MYKHFHFRHMHVRSASQKYFFARCLVMVVRGLLVSTSLSMSAYAPALPLPASGALPSGGVVSSGNGVISSSGTQMNVTQSSQKLVINWNSFDIGSNAAVNFNQPNAQAVALNRINSTSPSQIYGRLTANGQLFFINPNGVVFGPGSQVNAAALIVSTHNLSDANFLSGNYLFNPVSVNSAAILNQGSIQVHNGGVVTLIAHNINNVGSISAPGGTIGLLAGDTVTVPLSLQGSHPFMVSATSAGDASIINSGTLSAAGGTIQISALNSASSSNATTLTNNAVINNSGIIDVSSNTNNGGSIYTDSGVIGINQSSGTLLATSSQGLGGNITILGDKVGLLENSQTNADGALGGGTILIGGNWHGEGPEHNANVVYIDRAATIHADATSQGDGGQVVLWSDDYTGFYGLISARGGKLGGNGGQVETSSKKTLIVSGGRVVLFAAQGGVGRWLLDPGNVTISAAATTIVPAANVYTAPVSSMGYVSVADIDAALANGTSVTVTTGLASPDGVYGHMYVLSSINPLMTKGNATLTLTAALDISVASGVNIGPAATSTNALNLVFNANSAIVIGGNLSTNGGSILFNGNTSVQNSTVAQTFLTNGGAVTFGGANGRALLIANTRGFNIDTTVANGHAGAVTFNGTVDSGNQFSYVAGTVNWLQAHLGAQGYGCTLVNPGGCAASQHPNAIGASYLATINSAFENSLAGLSTCSATGTGCFSSAWLGGSRLTADLLTTTYDPVTHQYYFSNAAMKAALGCAAASTTCSPTLTSAPNGLPIATWQWVSGPLSLANNGKGTVFYNTTTNSATGPVNGVYTNWNSSTVGTGEPNNAGNEYALQFTGSNGVWNDLNPSSSGSATGYIVETNLAHSVLTINAGTGANAGVVTFNGLVGNAHPLASLNVTGQIAMQGGGVTTDSLQVYAGDMNLGANQNTILKQTGTIYNVDGTTSVSSVNFQLQPGHVITNGNSNETSLTIDTTGSINLNAGNNISSSGSNGKLNVTLNSDSAGALLGVTDTGIHIAGAAITTNGGSIALGGGAGTGTNAALGIALTNGGSLNSAGGNIALTSAANTAISMDAASQIAAGAGNISLIADTMQLPVAVSSRITGSGSLTLNTYTANRAIELGDTSGSGLNLAAGLFGGANATLAPGFSVITVGGANAGAITLGANTTFTSNLALVSGGAITLNGALNNSGNTVTLTGGNNALVSGNGNITASG
ncbi:MAG: filamentous hemagglutinin N-terminal domain-containing protein [Ottowia sp.]|nr:filamentous hemagglutinin N-terminal domain-containing protein [Ottowia sp.]